MKNYVRLIAPAKVNLVLAVGRTRDDGFHSVNTIMHSLALHDLLTMRRFEEDDDVLVGSGAAASSVSDDADSAENDAKHLSIVLKCETSGDIDTLNVAPEENIVYRAVEELAKELGRTENETIHILLSKVIPAEAGLGGGSSNAAAALLGAATLWGIDPQDERLYAVASRLGADVTFFLKGGCAYLSGKGEVFEHSLNPRKGFVLLVRPSAGVSTAKAYAAFDANPLYPDDSYVSSLANHDDANNVEFWNNLTDAARQVTPEVAEVLDWAKSLSDEQDVLLCGSGSAVCIVCDSYDEAYKLSLDAFKRGWWNRVTSFAPVGASVLEVY